MKATLILVFFFMSFSVLAQENNSKGITKDDKNKDSLHVEVAVSPKGAGSGGSLLNKIPLPVNQKTGPAIFYVKNDKPIDRSAYKPVGEESSVKK